MIIVVEVDVDVEVVEVDVDVDVEVDVLVEDEVVDVVDMLVDVVDSVVDVEVLVEVDVNAALSDTGLFMIMLGDCVAPLYAPAPDPLHPLNAYPAEGDSVIVTCDPAFSHVPGGDGDTDPPEEGDADIVR